jgi:ABC-type nitrate/sulfonate/bicarbonate transport system substrate-binding protein
MFAAAQRLFENRGVDFHLVAFETAAERGIEGLLAGEWDYIVIGVTPLVSLRADGHDPAIVVGTTPINTNFLMGRRGITHAAKLAGRRVGCLSLGGQTAAAARAVFERNGIKDGAELVPLGKYSRIFDAINAGDIDGAILAGDFRFLMARSRFTTRVRLRIMNRPVGFSAMASLNAARASASDRQIAIVS